MVLEYLKNVMESQAWWPALIISVGRWEKVDSWGSTRPVRDFASINQVGTLSNFVLTLPYFTCCHICGVCGTVVCATDAGPAVRT